MDQIRQAVERAKAHGSARPESASVLPPEPERVWQAVERAKGNAEDQHALPSESQDLVSERLSPSTFSPTPPRQGAEPLSRFRRVNLDPAHLEKNRVVAHSVADPRSKSFDILRTQVLQAMDQRKWQFLAITSPTKGCGKTLTAANLALSISRQPDRSVLLVDMDLPRPNVAKCLGIDCKDGVLGLLEGRTTLSEAIVEAHIDGCRPVVLAAEAASVRSSELIVSRAMSTLLQDIKRQFAGWTVIFDLPPILSSDDVISMLPRIDCVLLVAAVSTSTVHEIKECNKHLQSAHVLRLVLNKVHHLREQVGY